MFSTVDTVFPASGAGKTLHSPSVCKQTPPPPGAGAALLFYCGDDQICCTRTLGRHGSLEGVGGLKTNEAYHSKADALLITEMYFFENLPTPFFVNVCFFIKFGPFSALLALPVMIREEYEQIAHQTLPSILLSNASMVTQSCIARFVDDDAFNPCALSNCSTGPSPPLAHGKSTLSSFQANAGCLRPGLFGRFRSISEQTAHRSRKIRVQCEIPPFHVL